VSGGSSGGDERIRAQYEAYPYPQRDPKDEARRLVTGSPSHPLEIDHYLFGGRRDWRQPFRALVAGGGTGDGTIMLAQGMADRGCPAEIVYLDMSVASRRIAEGRAVARGLRNIRFATGSLLGAAELGPFDYVDCCGVLHHLADPAVGLAALVRALSPGGGIGLMLYGALGRTGVYPMQALLRTLTTGLPDAEKLALARRTLKDMPASNWLARNPHLADHLNSDAGLYDLLLHSRDRAYTVPDIYDLLESAGLRLVTFIEPLRYDPASYLRDPALRRRLAGLDPMQAAAAAENLCGSLKNHALYAVPKSRSGDTVARPDDSAVPVLRDADGPTLAKGLTPGAGLVADLGGVRTTFPLPRLAAAILARIDGRATLDEIRRALPSAPDRPAFRAEFDALYAVFNGLNRMLLRFPAAAPG
jgi:SAM-dependent methyltransferase